MIAGLVCQLGTVGAVEFKAFADSVATLPEERRRLLLRGQWALCSIKGGDISLERGILQGVLNELRDCWLKEGSPP